MKHRRVNNQSQGGSNNNQGGGSGFASLFTTGIKYIRGQK